MIVTLLLILCSALSKEIGITTVAICLLYELLIHRKVLLCIMKQYIYCRSYFQLSIGDVLSALKAHQRLAWLLSAFIFGGFVTSFLVFRLIINQGSPQLTYVLVRPAHSLTNYASFECVCYMYV